MCSKSIVSPKPGRLEEVSGVRPEDGELAELGPVALEVAVVDGVEAHERREQADVGFGDGVADEVAMPLESIRQSSSAVKSRS